MPLLLLPLPPLNSARRAALPLPPLVLPTLLYPGRWAEAGPS
jgi:hypothetical protein